MTTGWRTSGLLALAALAGAPALAADTVADTVALSPAERAAVLDAAAARTDTSPGDGRSRAIHGEMGVEIGSRGTRALYGTAVVPLGQTGGATISFLTARQNGWRGR